MISRAGPAELSRSAAWALLTEFTPSESLRKHARAVEASMRASAVRYDDDVEAWASPACGTTSIARCIPGRRITR